MGRKKPKQICPFLSAYGGDGSLQDPNYTGDIYCQDDKCALWDTWFDECSFLSIAHALGRKRIEEELERKKTFSPFHKRKP